MRGEKQKVYIVAVNIDVLTVVHEDMVSAR